MDVIVQQTDAPAATAEAPEQDLASLFQAEIDAESAPPAKAAPAAAKETQQPDGDDTADVAEETEAEEAEEPATDEPEDAAETPSDDTAIVAPSGMTKDDREKFATLPTEMQSWLARQATQTTADYTRKSQAVAEQKKSVDQVLQLVSSRLEVLDQHLSSFADRPIAPPDLALRNTDPYAYDEKLAEYLTAKHEQEVAVAQREKARKELEVVKATRQQQYMAERDADLKAKAPELFADKDFKAIRRIQEYAVKHGYAPEQLKMATADDILILWKAQKFDANEAARKNVKSVPPAPLKAAKPGPSKVGRPTAYTSAMKAFDERPSRENLAAMFEAEIRSEKR
ncbi:MAG: hypothetical protein ACRCS9_00720 [Hyphomicrobium sp.]